MTQTNADTRRWVDRHQGEQQTIQQGAIFLSFCFSLPLCVSLSDTLPLTRRTLKLSDLSWNMLAPHLQEMAPSHPVWRTRLTARGFSNSTALANFRPTSRQLCRTRKRIRLIWSSLCWRRTSICTRYSRLVVASFPMLASATLTRTAALYLRTTGPVHATQFLRNSHLRASWHLCTYTVTELFIDGRLSSCPVIHS